MNAKQLNSQNESVIFSEDCPVISSGTESSVFNRFKKYMRTVGQHEWISQFDLFSIPLKLSFMGQDSYKTEFGGIIVLLISIVCIFFTLVMQFPNGVDFSTQVEMINFQKSLDGELSLFAHTDTVLQVYFYDTTLQTMITNTSFVKDIKMYNVINNENIPLDISTDCPFGSYCLKKTPNNQQLKLIRNEDNLGYLKLQIMTCGDSDLECSELLNNVKCILSVTNFNLQTNKITTKTQAVQFSRYVARKMNIQKIQYTTNNIFFGLFANVLPKTIEFYNIEPLIVYYGPTQMFPPIGDNFKNCSDSDGQFQCGYIVLQYDGTTIQGNQRFLDLTAPILLFLSLKETLTFLAWILFLRNYSNNCLHLKLADSLVHISKPDQSHYNFKTGGWLVFTCLIYRHPFVQLLNQLLFRFCETDLIRMLPLQVQLTVQMINFGEECLNEKYFFGNLNAIYDLQNIRPTKIIPNLVPKQQNEDEDEDEDDDEQRKYFDNEVQELAFIRLCHDHEHFSSSRKQYISVLLKQKNKNHKLVLIVQEMFKRYKGSIEKQRASRVVEIPMESAEGQLSGNNFISKN